MDNRTGQISDLEHFKNLYGDKVKNRVTELSKKEHKTLLPLSPEQRPSHLAFKRLKNKSLPPKLMFIAGFQAAIKLHATLVDKESNNG